MNNIHSWSELENIYISEELLELLLTLPQEYTDKTLQEFIDKLN